MVLINQSAKVCDLGKLLLLGYIHCLHINILCHLLIVLGDTTVISRHFVSVGVVGCHTCKGKSCCAKGALDNWRHSWGSIQWWWVQLDPTHWAVEPIRWGWSRRCWRSCWSPHSCSCNWCLRSRSCNCPCLSPYVLQSFNHWDTVLAGAWITLFKKRKKLQQKQQ